MAPQPPAGPHRSGPLGADGPAVEQVDAPRGAERGLLPRWPPRPQPCPLPARAGGPAAATAPGGGGGMEPPPPPLPPRSPAEGREGSAPRQDPPLRPPPATSTPSLAPSLGPRALPLNGSESAKEGENGKKSPRPCPARRRRRPGRRGEERGAAAATGHRPRLGLTVAVRTRPGRGAATGSAPAAAPTHPGPARRGASPTRELGTFGSSGERLGSRSL